MEGSTRMAQQGTGLNNRILGNGLDILPASERTAAGDNLVANTLQQEYGQDCQDMQRLVDSGVKFSFYFLSFHMV